MLLTMMLSQRETTSQNCESTFTHPHHHVPHSCFCQLLLVVLQLLQHTLLLCLVWMLRLCQHASV